jgi:hypothetical protein
MRRFAVTGTLYPRRLRGVRVAAVERGQALKELASEALQEKLASRRGRARSGEPEWMQGFGKLRHLHRETARIQ